MADGERTSDAARPAGDAGRERDAERNRPAPPPPAASMKLRDELALYVDTAASG